MVTGANRGIGRAFVEALLAGGAKRVYAAARKVGDLDAVVGMDRQRVVPVVLDVTKVSEVKAAAGRATDVNLLINNAGALGFGSLTQPGAIDHRRDMEVNYFGMLEVTAAFAPVLAGNGGGAVANILSVVSLASMPGAGGYCASKAAAWSATMALRSDLAKQRTRVHAVFPGPVDTEMAKEFVIAKAPAIEVAREVLAGIAAGQEDIFPDAMAKLVYAGWSVDHKAVEKQFAAM